jgi:hypothetical protein
LQLGTPPATVRRVVHNRLHPHAYWQRKPRQQIIITLYFTIVVLKY